MAATGDNWMDFLSNNILFNTGGWIGVNSSLGLAVAQAINLVTANQILTLILSSLSIIFVSIKILSWMFSKSKKTKENK